MIAGPGEVIVHATCVADPAGRGLLILGPSGSGKSALALRLMGLGARLVADDRTILARSAAGTLRASCPAATRGLIEARGVGVLRVAPVAAADVAMAVDLSRAETERLPPRREIVLEGVAVELVLGPATPHFPASLLFALAGGRL